MPQTEAQKRLYNLAKKQDGQAAININTNTQTVAEPQNEAKKEETISDISLSDVTKQRRIQNLGERTELLRILKHFFFFQLAVMNLVVGALVFCVVFDFKFLNDIQTADLQICVSFMKYYISAILVELLGGIIFVVHKVFSEKF